jgi:2-polyprenyl-3-methyl-5-hydroxy-6-metoxy-1,4-benzoquinol methylase
MTENSYYQQSRTEVLSLIRNQPTCVLDIGCGKGGFSKLLRAHYPEINIVGFDKYRDKSFDYDAVFDNFFEVDLSEKWPSINYEKFDFVFLLDVLEHLIAPQDVLLNLRSLLNPNAKIIISLPNFHYYSNLLELVKTKRFQYKDSGILDRTHLRFYGEQDARQLIEDIFKIEGYLPHHLYPLTFLGRFVQFTLGNAYSAYQNIYLCSQRIK